MTWTGTGLGKELKDVDNALRVFLLVTESVKTLKYLYAHKSEQNLLSACLREGMYSEAYLDSRIPRPLTHPSLLHVFLKIVFCFVPYRLAS